ncbi:unnamed protein product [Rotaria sp. Silwood2]|nr:unnamed protein product [Rotaria sp. Silwood2]CAF4131410.1 unnamed protein product [Rotaria sp. Silwood2]
MNCAKTVLIFVSMVISLAIGSMPRTDVTVSGISSGGAMAIQLHMAYSNDISGCGILAGPPYYCAGNLMAATACMSGPLNFVTAPGIMLKLKWYDSIGSVDDISNIQGDPVYIFTGKYDLVARPSTVKLNEDVYSKLGANIKTNYDMAATHGFPTDNFGKSCATLNLENYINNCDFNMAYDILNHLYGGNLIKPRSGTEVPLIGQMAIFDQKAFMNPPSSLTESHTPSSSLLKWISERKYYVDDVFATKAGYLEVAELNNLIVVFPQVAPTMFLPTNPMGCWDWWGYSSLSYATKTAPQIVGVKKMIDTVRLINQAMVASV